MQDQRPTHLDLFSGIGGFSLALESEGFRTIGFSEIDDYASAVLRKHWPGVKNYGDVRSIPTAELRGQVSVITGGFPCQPFSVAGKQRGKEDDRYLWPAMLRVIEEVRPSFVVGENVIGFINLALDDCLSQLESIGYTAIPFVVPACAVDARHQRKRVWIVGYAESEQSGRLQQSGISSDIGAAGEQSAPLANANGARLSDGRQTGQQKGESEAIGRMALAKPERCGISRWPIEPAVDRVAHGLSNRVDRLKCLGNAIVPQVAQVFAKGIYKCIMQLRDINSSTGAGKK